MSTCPKDDLRSAYFDSEIVSPWKEKLETHLSECADCSHKAVTYEKMHTMLQSDSRVLTDEEMTQSFVRLQSRLRHEAIVKTSYPMPLFAGVSRSAVVSTLAAALMVAVVLPTAFFAGANQKKHTQLPLISNALVGQQQEPFIQGVIAEEQIRQVALTQDIVQTANMNTNKSLSSIDLFRPEFSQTETTLRITLPAANDISFVVYISSNGLK